MRQCKVIGHVVATIAHPALAGQKILVVAPVEQGGDPTAPMSLALDGVGAGIGSRVIVSESGTAGSEVTGLEQPPVRSVIVGFVD